MPPFLNEKKMLKSVALQNKGLILFFLLWEKRFAFLPPYN